MVLLVGWWAVAQAGPLSVSYEDVVLEDPRLGEIPARVYLPDAGGPYPLAGFLHGWLGQAWMYDEVCVELASWGFVVASIDTQTGLFLETDRYADEAVAMLDAVEARARAPGDPWSGRVSDGDRVALGHSMGGATLMRWVTLDPRITTAIAFMPYEGYPSYYRDLEDWGGSLLVLAGTDDTTAPPRMQDAWMDAVGSAARALRIEVQGMGHQAVTDLSFDEDAMPDEQQRAWVIDLATAFVRAEFQGEEDRWADLVGPGLDGLDADLRSRSTTPALWVEPGEDEVRLGVAAFEGDVAEVFFGRTDATGALVEEVSAGALTLEGGVGEASVALPAGWTGELAVAVAVDGEAGPGWTRAVSLVEGDAPATEPPADDAPAGTVGDPAAVARDSCGCAARPSPSPAWAALALLVARRRSWRRVPVTRAGRSSTSPSGS